MLLFHYQEMNKKLEQTVGLKKKIVLKQITEIDIF